MSDDAGVIKLGLAESMARRALLWVGRKKPINFFEQGSEIGGVIPPQG